MTAADFVCRGEAGRSVAYRGKTYEDCAGGHLPVTEIDGRLLVLLNQLQDDIGEKIVVTSGYRCEAHNLYSWAFVAARTGDRKGVSLSSLHRAGAACDFYIDGERDFRKYKDAARRAKALASKSKEMPGVLTRLYRADEVRDPDNQHDYPYIHVHILGVARRAAAPAPVQGR